MNATYTNVAGSDELLDRIVDCWPSLFGERVVAYRASRGLAEEPAMAVVVQRMVDSEQAGVLFTADPSTGDPDRLVIEAAFGLGEVVVGGQVEPDTYVVARDGPRLLEARVGRKAEKIVRGPDGRDMRMSLPPEEAAARVLTDSQILELARIGLMVESHYGAPQDIEWAMSQGSTYLVQSRPITTLPAAPYEPGRPLASGLRASPGVAAGRVRVLSGPAEGGRPNR